MIVFISAAATERLMVAAATKSLPAGFPNVQILESGNLQTDAEIDSFLARAGAETCVFVVRALGGKNYFERGFVRCCCVIIAQTASDKSEPAGGSYGT